MLRQYSLTCRCGFEAHNITSKRQGVALYKWHKKFAKQHKKPNEYCPGYLSEYVPRADIGQDVSDEDFEWELSGKEIDLI